MYFIKNYKEWVNDDIISYLDSLTTGEVEVGHVRVSDTLKSERDPITLKPWNQWFDFMEEMKSKGIDLPEMPVQRQNTSWWIVRLKPGQFQPIHVDPHLLGSINPKRYTIFLQDYEPGHIYIYDENKIAVNYKAGDLYEWDEKDYYKLHGAANISYKTRYTVQICMHDGIPEGDKLGSLDDTYRNILD